MEKIGESNWWNYLMNSYINWQISVHSHIMFPLIVCMCIVITIINHHSMTKKKINSWLDYCKDNWQKYKVCRNLLFVQYFHSGTNNKVWRRVKIWRITFNRRWKIKLTYDGVRICGNTFRQKYSRLRCLLRVKGLVIGCYLGWSGHTLLIRKI